MSISEWAEAEQMAAHAGSLGIVPQAQREPGYPVARNGTHPDLRPLGDVVAQMRREHDELVMSHGHALQRIAALEERVNVLWVDAHIAAKLAQHAPAQGQEAQP